MQREAMVLNETTGNPVLDTDPMMLTCVGANVAELDRPLVQAMWTLDAVTVADTNGWQYGLVWSDTRTPVTAACTCCGVEVSTSQAVAVEDDDDGLMLLCVDD
jgi:hypothetical protein